MVNDHTEKTLRKVFRQWADKSELMHKILHFVPKYKLGTCEKMKKID